MGWLLKCPKTFGMNFSLFVVRDCKGRKIVFITLHYVNMHIMVSMSHQVGLNDGVESTLDICTFVS